MSEGDLLQQLDRTYVRFRNRKLSYFSGCDYFRLASHPKVLAAWKEGIKKYGSNVSASRLTTGEHVLYRRLEQRLVDFFRAPAALLVPTGYQANLVVAQGLCGNFSHALVDEKAHPSLCDAARLLDCPVLRFQHRSPDDVLRGIRRCGPAARLVLLTDGMFSHDGSAAPLAAYLRILPKDAWLLVDDAHAGGVLGRTGKGSLEHAGISRRHIIQTLTLSKAFGTYGGVVLTTHQLRRQILGRSQIFIGSTPPPLPIAYASLRAVELLKENRQLRERLNENAQAVKAIRTGTNGSVSRTEPGPILMVAPKSARRREMLRRTLLRAGIYPPFVRYPGGPKEGYFRFVISSEHTQAQIQNLRNVLLADL